MLKSVFFFGIISRVILLSYEENLFELKNYFSQLSYCKNLYFYIIEIYYFYIWILNRHF